MDRVWHDKFPKEKGYYLCLVEGEEIELYHFICVMNGKHRWYIGKNEEITGDIKWSHRTRK